MLRGVQALKVPETAEHRLVRAQLLRVPVAKRFGHAVRQNSLRVRDRRDDAGNDVVQKLENRFGMKWTIVRFRPKAGTGIDEVALPYEA
jgi:hypothetical protein